MTDATDDLEDQHTERYSSYKVKNHSTLMDYFWSLNIRNGDTLTPIEILEIISDYLEEKEF